MDSIGRKSADSPSWRNTDFSSSTITTTSASTGDELENPFIFPDDHPHANPTIVSTRSYNQLLDDLSIIDNIYDNYDSDVEQYDKQVLEIARNVAQKYRTAQHLYQREKQYIHNLQSLREGFAAQLRRWCDQAPNANILSRNKISEKDFEMFCDYLALVINTHRSFLRKLGDRLQMWGPTQLVSDIFTNLYDGLLSYEPFLKHYSNFIVTLDTLCKSTRFPKFIEQYASENNRSVQDVFFQLRIPISQVLTYSNAVAQMTQYTEPSHPDHYALSRLARTFQTRETIKWQPLVTDIQNHLRAFEAFRFIQGCPAVVTATRRLLLVSEMVKIDLADPASVADVRTYFLYNDMLIVCKKHKDKKEGDRLVYKSSIELKNANVRLLPSQIAARIVDARKPSTVDSLFSRKHSETHLPTAAYGFDIWMSELCQEAILDLSHDPTMRFNAQLRRRHAVRTRSLAEQNLWVSTLLKVIRSL
ncbi:epithelial cell transforming sequence 2 oncoprotein-like [Apophysomyces ossiformis]|uniref:Epithelial cell transforming sequence 2 oncoprotein-like n=1 Tax=Apophysomyces ossiformis TaxID=679940 RepID=A0A8H7BQS9_9FUNG|nr:epithelial cell transforming sequence 2 oncoprotein-like [Apophysomyces ossiformis]